LDSAASEARSALRSLRVDPPDDGFAARLHERLVAEGPPRAAGLGQRLADAWARWRGRLVWSAAGALVSAAAFALVLAARGAAPPAPIAPADPASATVTEAVHVIPVDKVAVIRLNFTAEVAIEDVAFEVRLPEGLSFWSEGRTLPERLFVWRGSLAAGDNQVPIAVRGARPGRYRVVTTAGIDRRRVEHAVVLEVTGA
jgi:hypothetical protein